MQEKAKVLNTSLKLTDLDVHEFYLAYVKILSSTMPNEQRLSPKECDLVAYLLSFPIHHCQFRGTPFLRLMKHFNVNVNTARTYRRNIKNKGWLTKSSFLNPQLTAIQNMMHQVNPEELNFTITLRPNMSIKPDINKSIGR